MKSLGIFICLFILSVLVVIWRLGSLLLSKYYAFREPENEAYYRPSYAFNILCVTFFVAIVANLIVNSEFLPDKVFQHE